MFKTLLNNFLGENFKMKNLLLAVIVFLSFFVASLTINTGTVSANVTDPPYHETVIQGNIKIIFEYDGPGGKLVNIVIEHID
jgi:hypothetical protein